MANPLSALTAKKNRTFVIIGLVAIGGFVLFSLLAGRGGGGGGQAVQQGPSEQLQMAQLQAQTQLAALQYQGQISATQAQLAAETELAGAQLMAQVQQEEIAASLAGLQSQLTAQTYIAELEAETSQAINLATIEANRANTAQQISAQLAALEIDAARDVEMERLQNEAMIAQRQIDAQIYSQQATLQYKAQKSSNKWGFLGSVAGGLLGLFSDVRVKENIEFTGFLPNGLPMYRYNYVGDETPQAGVMAQDVEIFEPNAVLEIDGVKAVNYSAVM